MQPEEEPKEEQDAAPSIRRVRFRFEGNESLLEKIRRAQEILRHKFPKGSLEEIVDQALEDLLEKRDPWRGIKRRERRKRAREAENQSPP
ncbi:MAG: hypothetical protein COB53_08700 [Elusimicrobia bacterium]|nr:MAG: hypothetical protein COB53_08700 [Elusimicrobiota bacterium]